MVYSTQVVSFIVPLVLVGLIVASGVALYRVRAFALPISTGTATSAIILPVLTGISLRFTQQMARRAKSRFSGFVLAAYVLLVIYETVIATLAITHILPPGNLECGLDRQWARLFSNKNAETIKRIQDRHQCCGLHSVLDRAWPFPDKSHAARACAQAFDRQRSCLPGWRRDEQTTGGLILFVAIAVFLLKLLLLIVYRIEPSVLATWLTRRSQFRTDDENWDPHNENQGRNHVRGQIEEPYRDSSGSDHDDHNDHTISPHDTITAADQGEDRSPVMQPSTLRNDGENEWRQVRSAA